MARAELYLRPVTSTISTPRAAASAIARALSGGSCDWPLSRVPSRSIAMSCIGTHPLYSAGIIGRCFASHIRYVGGARQFERGNGLCASEAHGTATDEAFAQGGGGRNSTVKIASREIGVVPGCVSSPPARKRPADKRLTAASFRDAAGL